MKNYIFLLAGLVLAFQACKKSDSNNNSSSGSNNNNNNVPLLKACFVPAHLIVDSAQRDTFNAVVCSENAVSYRWQDVTNGGASTGETWSEFFTGPSSQPNRIELTVTGANGKTKDTNIYITCGFHQFQSFVINKLNISADSFYITYYPINQSVTYKTATYTTSKVTGGYPFVIPINPLSINPANSNTSKWIVLIVNANTGGTYTSFSFTDNRNIPGETPYTRTFNAVTNNNLNININYTISPK